MTLNPQSHSHDRPIPRGDFRPRLGIADCVIRADGLEVARAMPGHKLDLIYLDPPFGVGKRHRALRGRGDRHAQLEGVSYHDPAASADGGLGDWLEALVRECPRILRPGGALFLHLDYRRAHRAKLLLDDLFGAEHFLNEIIWHYATGGIPAQWFARKHDTILYYRNGDGHTFQRLTEKKYLAHRMARRGVPEFQDDGGWYRFRSLDDVWNIPWLTPDSKERTGYPTQKPLALLERILSAASREGDLIGDFCAGSGTTAVAAVRLGRAFIVADCEEAAVSLTRQRLETEMLRKRGEIAWDGASARSLFCCDWTDADKTGG